MHELEQLGLSHYESKVLELLFKEKVTLKKLSRGANIPPGKVYSVVKQLVKEKLIQETKDRPKKVYVSDASQIINTLIERKQKEQEELFKHIRTKGTITNKVKSQNMPFFQYGSKLEDNENIQMRTFQEAKKEVCQILNNQHKPKSNRKNKTKWEKEIEKAIKRGVTFRCIYPEKTTLPNILKLLPPEKFIVRRFNTDFTRCDIIDSKKVMIKLVNQDSMAFGGIIFIEDEQFAKNLQSVFEQFWEESKYAFYQ